MISEKAVNSGMAEPRDSLSIPSHGERNSRNSRWESRPVVIPAAVPSAFPELCDLATLRQSSYCSRFTGELKGLDQDQIRSETSS